MNRSADIPVPSRTVWNVWPADGRLLRTAAWVVLAMAWLVSIRQATALVIQPIYDAEQSSPPSFDPDGSGLQAIVSEAASTWESIFEEDNSIDIHYWWFDLDDEEGTLAQEVTTSVSALGKPREATIEFDTASDGAERHWYFDPMPGDSIEFDLQQKRVGDFPDAEIEDWYTGTPPDTLEVSYAGSATSEAPVTARTAYDLFSIALHEIGHAVGMNPSVARRETDDGDYDLLPPHVDAIGGTGDVGVRTHSANNPAHLNAPGAPMFPSFGVGTRRLPSVTDVMAIASAAKWFDLPMAGDMDINGIVDFDDIDPFVLGLGNPVAYVDLFDESPVVRGDVNGSRAFDFDDIGPFMSVLAGEPVASRATVPEPGTSLLALAAIVLFACRRQPTGAAVSAMARRSAIDG